MWWYKVPVAHNYFPIIYFNTHKSLKREILLFIVF